MATTKILSVDAADENTPLLIAEPAITVGPEAEVQTANGSHDPKSNGNGNANEAVRGGIVGDEEEKPLPRLQIALLCFARMIEPMAFFGIFPFVNKMIQETGGLEEADVGFYSGLIESLFSLTQMLLMIQWGRAADRIGRKPVLVFSLIGVAIGTALFGLSKRIWQMILFRCGAGVFAGTLVTVRTMLTENSTPRTQARTFSFFAFSGNLGIFLGPLLGGILQSPAEQYGGMFKRISFFTEFPYALPTFVNGFVALIAVTLCILFLKETLKKEDKSDTAGAPPLMSTWQIVTSPGVPIVLFLYGHVMLLGLAYTAVSPLWWYTSIQNGGFGFTPIQISSFVSLVGISQAIWLLFVFPPLQNKVGTGAILRGCLYFWPLFFAIAPLGNWLLRHEWTTTFWVFAIFLQISGSGVSMAFTGVQLAVNDISPSPQTLGTLNAVALTLVSGIRAVAPTLFTSIFAVGVHTQVLDGYLIWVVLVVLALLGSVTVRYLPEKAEGRLKKMAPVEEES